MIHRPSWRGKIHEENSLTRVPMATMSGVQCVHIHWRAVCARMLAVQCDSVREGTRNIILACNVCEAAPRDIFVRVCLSVCVCPEIYLGVCTGPLLFLHLAILFLSWL